MALSVYGCLWGSTGVYGWLWEFMRVMGVWKYMGFYRCLEIYGYVWMAMEVHAYYGCLSEFIGVYRSLWALIGVSECLRVYGCLLEFIDSYGCLWVSIGVLTVWVFMDLWIYVSGGI